METEEQWLMIRSNYEPVSEFSKQPVEKISRCQA